MFHNNKVTTSLLIIIVEIEIDGHEFFNYKMKYISLVLVNIKRDKSLGQGISVYWVFVMKGSHGKCMPERLSFIN